MMTTNNTPSIKKSGLGATASRRIGNSIIYVVLVLMTLIMKMVISNLTISSS